jgi:hypothetical protein
MVFIERYKVWVTENGEVFREDKAYQYKARATRLGYKQLSLRDHVKGKRASVGVHRLIAMAYIPNPENKPEINHIDGNAGNNAVSNLEWCTRQENMLHANRTGLMEKRLQKIRKIERHRAIVDLLEIGRSRQFIADAFGISTVAIGLALKNNKHFLELFEKQEKERTYRAREYEEA